MKTRTGHSPGIDHCESGTFDAELRPFLTRCEVAELLRISERTVRRLESEGRLRSLKLTPGRAGRVIFRREELLRFVAQAENRSLS